MGTGNTHMFNYRSNLLFLVIITNPYPWEGRAAYDQPDALQSYYSSLCVSCPHLSRLASSHSVYGAAEEKSSQHFLLCSVLGRVRVTDCVGSELLEKAERCYPVLLLTL